MFILLDAQAPVRKIGTLTPCPFDGIFPATFWQMFFLLDEYNLERGRRWLVDHSSRFRKFMGRSPERRWVHQAGGLRRLLRYHRDPPFQETSPPPPLPRCLTAGDIILSREHFHNLPAVIMIDLYRHIL